MKVFLVKCRIDCGNKATKQGYARMFKVESDTESEAEIFKKEFKRKYKHFGT